jgi:hypothetical protein
MRTGLAVLDVTAQGGSAAYLNRHHDASLGEVDVAVVGCAPRLAMAAKDFRYLQLRPKHAWPRVRSETPAK